jgi:hypothetical protein
MLLLNGAADAGVPGTPGTGSFFGQRPVPFGLGPILPPSVLICNTVERRQAGANVRSKCQRCASALSGAMRTRSSDAIQAYLQVAALCSARLVHCTVRT